MKHLALHGILMIIFLFLTLQKVEAQKFSSSVAPSSYEIVSKSGQTILLPYSFSNIGDPSVVRLNVYHTFEKDSQGTLDLLPLDQSTAPSQISFSLDDADIALNDPFLFQSDKTIVTQLKIVLPEDLPEGDYLVSMVLESEEQPGFENTSRIYLAGSIASPVLITVTNSGAINRDLGISIFHITSPASFSAFGKKFTFLDSYAKIPMNLTVVNSGKNAAHVHGAVEAHPIFSQNPDDAELQKMIEKQKDTKNQDKNLAVIYKQIIFASSQKMLKTDTSQEETTGVLPGKLAGIYRVTGTVFTDMIPEKILKNEQYLIIFPFTFSMIIGGLLLLSIIVLLWKEKYLKK